MIQTTRYGWITSALLLATLQLPLVLNAAVQDQAVTVYRDEWGVPHIYADSEEAGFFGLGYAQAEDQLEGILKRYLGVLGKSSSVFGKDHLTSDLHNLQWMFAEEADQHYSQLDDKLQRNFRHFVAGIRSYMDKHPEKVPDWAPALKPSLPIAFLNSALWSVNEVVGIEDARRGGVPLADSGISPGLSMASNSWVVSPWRTKDNVVIHLADSHVPFDGIVRVFEFRLHAGPIHVSGFSGSGLVLPVTAHNRHVAWGVTMGGPDVADCYEIKTDHDNPRRYKYDETWQKMTVKEVTVRVRGEADVTREFEYTHHNGVLCPVVARQGDAAYVICSAYMHRAGMLENQLYKMLLSESMDDMANAMSLLDHFSQNVMVGSADGHTMYVRAGRVPIRPEEFDFMRPVAGNTSTTAWKGIYPFDRLVVVKDPSCGYMTNNNVSPDMMTATRTVDASSYPIEVFFDKPGFVRWRGTRSLDLLSTAFSMTQQDAFDVALDEKWEGTEVLLNALKNAVVQKDELIEQQTFEFREVVDGLLRFDGRAEKESVAALHFLYWKKELLANPETSGVVDLPIDQRKLDGEMADALINSIERTVAALKKAHGDVRTKLGDIYRVGRGDTSFPIGGVTFSAGGADHQTLRAMLSLSKADPSGRFWIDVGQRQPMVTLFTRPVQSFTSAPFGQSDDPSSPHYSDQARLLSEKRFKPSFFNKEELTNHIKSKVVLSVSGID